MEEERATEGHCAPRKKHIDILLLLQVQNEGVSPDVADGEEIHKGDGVEY